MPDDKKEKSFMSFDDAFQEVIRNLKGQPLLLFVLGAGLLILAGAATVKDFQSIAFPLLFLFALGIVVWGFLEINKVRQGKMTTGSVKIGKNVKAENSEVNTGGISGGTGKSDSRTGDVTIGTGADLKGVKIGTGQVKVESGKEKKDGK